MDRETVAGRVFALVKEAGETDASFAVAMGVSKQVAGNWKSRGNVPAAKLYEAARWLSAKTGRDISSEYLYSGEIGTPNEARSVREMAATYDTRNAVGITYYTDIKASAGQGCVPVDEATVRLMEVSRSVLEQNGVAASDAALLQADGPSMSGVIEHGDIMLLDLSKPAGPPQDGRIYVVRINDELYVKRVQRVPGGIVLLSANKEYDPIRVQDEDQGVDLQIIGQVATAWRIMDFTNG